MRLDLRVYIAKPGTQVTLIWDEFTNHPNFFRIDITDETTAVHNCV